MMGTVEVGTDDKGVGTRGSGCPDVRNVLRGSLTGSPVVWFVDVGYVPAHWEDLGRIPPKVGSKTDGTATVEMNGQGVGAPPSGRGDGGSGP